MQCSASCARSQSSASLCRCKCNGAGHGSGVVYAKSTDGSGVGGRTTVERVPFGETQRRALSSAFDQEDKQILHEIQPFGSMSRRTNNIESGDMDFLLIYNTSRLRGDGPPASSEALLARTKTVIDKHFPNANARRDGQAISLELDGSRVDVVPSLHDGFSIKDKDPIYRIPDGHGAWIRTCPDGINRYLADANAKSGGQLRTTTRSVKLFTQRTSAGVPIKSIYIELAVAQSNATVGVKTKEQAMRDAFVSIRSLGCQPIADPTGVGDPIHAASTSAKKALAQKQLDNVAEWSERAVAARERGENKEAGRLWGLIFGGKVLAQRTD